jgi:glycosyltransferase involved in cell wall biosynthesis
MKQTIILIYTTPSTFVATDKKLLEKEYNVITYQFHSHKNTWVMLREFIKQLIFIIKNIRKADIIFSWFSDFHSLIPFIFARLLGKKTVVVVGGFDAVSIPELQYGLFYKKNLRQYFGIWSYKLSNLILPVDDSLIKSTNYYADSRGLKVGVKNYLPNIKAQIKSIPTGYDINKWTCNPTKRDKDVIAFGFASNMQKFVGKGYDFLIEIAKKMPDVHFTLISIKDEMRIHAEKISPKNVTIIGALSLDKLKDEITHHKVYALLSMSEGMPSSLCEAMLCGCVPVGSNVGGIKNVIGDCGYVLNNKNIDEAVLLINKALDSNEEFANRGKQRITELFHIDRRENELMSALKSLYL